MRSNLFAPDKIKIMKEKINNLENTISFEAEEIEKFT